MAKRKKGYRRVYDEGTGKTKLGRRKEVDVYRPLTGVGKTLVKDITYKSDDSPRVKYTEREVTRRNKDGSVKSYKNIVRKNGKIVEEATTKKIKYKDGGPKVKQRRGVRENPDGSVSSHLMRAEYIPERGWVGFPSLFQDSKPYADDQQNWVDMSEEEDWMKIYEEAERRGEVYDFGEDKEAALAFGMGSWKDQLPDEGMEVELSDEEVERYRAGGYVLEEMHKGGEPGHIHDPLMTYDPNDPSFFESRYNNEFKLDQSQDGLKPENFYYPQPLLNLNGTDPDAEYNQWVANKPVNKRASSKSLLTHMAEGIMGIPELLTETIPNYIAETAEDAYDQFSKTSIVPSNINEGLDDLYHLPANLLAEDYSSYSTRDKAFAQARADGETSFMYKGKRFNTRREDDDIKLTFETDDPDEQYVFQYLTDETKKEYPILWNLMNKASGIDEISFDGVGSRWISKFDEKSMQEKNRGYFDEGMGLGDGASIHVGETPFESDTYDRFINVLIAELAHRTGHQPSNNPFQDITHEFKSVYENIKYGDEKRYQTPGTDEFNNHRLTEPGIHMTVRGQMTPAIVKKVQNFLGVEEDGIFGEDTYLTMVDRFKDNELIKQMLEEYAKRNPKDKHPELPISFGEEALWATYLNVLSAHVPELSKSTGSWKPYTETVQNMGDEFIIPFTKESFKDRKITDFNIRELQSFLAQQGYELPNSVEYVDERYGTLYDGIVGDETKTAFKNYRKKLGYKKQGGFIEAELTPKEVARYVNGGYVLEEMHDGGEPGHTHEEDPPDDLTFAQKKQAYDDSTTLYNYSQSLINLKDDLEAWPTMGEAYGEGLNTDSFDDGEYDRYLEKTAPGKLARFHKFIDNNFTGNTPEANAFLRLARLNEGYPGYNANTLNIPSGMDQYESMYFTTYHKPKVPIRKPSMKEAYKNVDKDKYPTFEDFVFAAEFYKETGTNPDPENFPSRRLPPPPEPQYKVEDIEPEIEIERLPIITPTLTTDNNLEIIGDYDEPEELVRPDYSNYQGIEEVRDRFNPNRRKGAHKMRQRISAKIAQALTGYDAEKMDAEIEAADKEGRRINFENMGLGAVSNKKFRKKYNQEYDKYEEDLKKQEYLKAVPRFFKDGGSMELELSPEEVSMYANGGYVLEEIPSYKPGGANDFDNPLQEWNRLQKEKWNGIYEWDDAGKAALKEYNKRMGVTYKPSDHWSAITISNAVMANYGANSRDEIRALGFNPTKSHSSYVADAFKTNRDPDYKYNKYIAEKPTTNLDYNVGDILVKGRRRSKKDVGTSKWSYEDFATHGSGYVSHGDIIVGKGTDDKGDYVITAGGNLGDTYKNQKVYVNTIASKYKVKLKDTDFKQKVGAAPSSKNKASASMEKINNVGEDVTVNTKNSSPFSNNFDWDTENDQESQSVSDVSNTSMPPISNFSGSLMPNQQASLFGDNTLGIGYVPYQYQFPEYLGRPQEEEIFEDLYGSPYENILDDDNSDVTNQDAETEDPLEDDNSVVTVDGNKESISSEKLEKLNEEDLKKYAHNKLSISKRKTKHDKFHEKVLDEETKLAIEELENEIYELKKSDVDRANEISKQIKALEEFGDETLNERKELAKERVSILLNINGNKMHSDEYSTTLAIKELKEQIKVLKLNGINNAIDAGELTTEAYYNKYNPGYIKSTKAIDKKMKDGYIWVSWNQYDPYVKEEMENKGFPSIMYESLDELADYNYWRDRVKGRTNQKSNIYNSGDNNDVKFIEEFYGDGSSKYGSWYKADDLAKAGGFSNSYLHPEQYNEDGSLKLEYRMHNQNLNLQNSGRATMFYPEWNLLESKIFGPLWGALGLGEDIISDERTVPYQEQPSVTDEIGSNIGDLFWSMKPRSMMDDNEKKRYYNMLKERTKNTGPSDGDKMMNIIQGNSAMNPNRSFKSGGYIVDLNKEEALAYAKKGYIVEEIK